MASYYIWLELGLSLIIAYFVIIEIKSKKIEGLGKGGLVGLGVTIEQRKNPLLFWIFISLQILVSMYLFWRFIGRL